LPVTSQYNITGTVTGLASGTSLTIQDTDQSSASVVVNGAGSTAVPFTLETLASGAGYNVTLTAPSAQTCTFPGGLTSASGTITANVALSVTCTVSLSTALNNPNGLAISNGNLYAANSGANEVVVYSVQVNSSHAVTGLTAINTITAGISSPTRLAFDTAGDLYVTNLGSNSVTVYDPTTFTQITTATITAGINRPLGVAVDQSGKVYVANNSGNSITVYSGTPAAGFTLTATLTQDGSGNQFLAPGAVQFAALGGENELLVALGPGSGTNYVFGYTAPLTASSVPNGSLNNNSCSTGPSGPSGAAVYFTGELNTSLVYIASYYDSSVSAYTFEQLMAGGSACQTPAVLSTSSSAIAQPEGVAVDQYGNVFVSNSSANTITAYVNIAAAPVYTQQ
jgi:YVTN family beta-propeller protein